jgi:hypothetical protein
MQKSQVECEQPSEEQSHEEDMPQSWPSFMHRAQQSPHCDGDADRSLPRMWFTRLSRIVLQSRSVGLFSHPACVRYWCELTLCLELIDCYATEGSG